MINQGRSNWQMEEQSTSYDVQQGQILLWGPSPIILKFFYCVADDRVDDQVELDKHEHKKLKDKGDQLVEVNFATKAEER